MPFISIHGKFSETVTHSLNSNTSAVGGRVVRRCWVNFQCRSVLLIWILVGQGPTVLAVGVGGVVWTFFSRLSFLSSFSLSLWETARYRLKTVSKGR